MIKNFNNGWEIRGIEKGVSFFKNDEVITGRTLRKYKYDLQEIDIIVKNDIAMIIIHDKVIFVNNDDPSDLLDQILVRGENGFEVTIEETGISFIKRYSKEFLTSESEESEGVLDDSEFFVELDDSFGDDDDDTIPYFSKFIFWHKLTVANFKRKEVEEKKERTIKRNKRIADDEEHKRKRNLLSRNDFIDEKKTIGLAMTGGLDSTYLLIKAIKEDLNIVLYHLMQHSGVEMAKILEILEATYKLYPDARIKMGGEFKFNHSVTDSKFVHTVGQMPYVSNLINLIRNVEEIWYGYTELDFTAHEVVDKVMVLDSLKTINEKTIIPVVFPLISNNKTKVDIINELPLEILEHIGYCDNNYRGKSSPCGSCTSCSQMNGAVIEYLITYLNNDKIKSLIESKALPEKSMTIISREFLIKNIRYVLERIVPNGKNVSIDNMKGEKEGYKFNVNSIGKVNMLNVVNEVNFLNQENKKAFLNKKV